MYAVNLTDVCELGNIIRLHGNTFAEAQTHNNNICVLKANSIC